MNYDRLLNDIVTIIADEVQRELIDTNWTRGHWYANQARDRIIIETREGSIIAVIGQSQVGRVKALSNAQLIVAAPLLYKALDNLVVSAYDPEEGDCLICGAQCAWGGSPHEEGCEVETAVEILALARGEKRG